MTSIGGDDRDSIASMLSTTYADDFIECTEHLPLMLQQHISEYRRLDAHYVTLLNHLDCSVRTYRELLEGSTVESTVRTVVNDLVCAVGSPYESRSAYATHRSSTSHAEKSTDLLRRISAVQNAKLACVTRIRDCIESNQCRLDENERNLNSFYESLEASANYNMGASPSYDSFAEYSDPPLTNNHHAGARMSIAAKPSPAHSSTSEIPVSILGACSPAYSDLGAGGSGGSSGLDHHHPTSTSVTNGPLNSSAVKKPRQNARSRRSESQNTTNNNKTTPATAKRRSNARSESIDVNNSDSVIPSATKKTRRSIAQRAAEKLQKAATPASDSPVDPNEPIYCICQQISFGEMISCDNRACSLEWFHFSCVSLARPPKGKWYCPECRGDRANSMRK